MSRHLIFWCAIAVWGHLLSVPSAHASVIGWVAGGSPYAATTTDGSTWTSQGTAIGVPSSNQMNAVFAISPTTAIVAGNSGVFLRTTDGGTTWGLATDTGSHSWKGLDFVDSSNGWAVGNDYWVGKTTDGGANWTASQIVDTPKHDLNAVDFVDLSTGWAVGNSGDILKTADGGSTWGLATPTSSNLFDVMFLNSTVGWAVGANGTILNTTNGGGSWGTQTSPVTQNLNSVWFASATLGWAVGNNGKILKTTNGSTWSETHDLGAMELNGIAFVGSQTGWIAGNNGEIFGTTDGGSTWVSQFGPSGIPALRNISFVQASTQAVPEPGTVVLFSTGLFLMLASSCIRRRHSSKKFS